MTEEELAAFCQERKRLAHFIIAHPARFYVCEGCDAILDGIVPIDVCPRCGSYQFSHESERLLNQLDILVKQSPEELNGEYEE